jgi:DNA ligase 1
MIKPMLASDFDESKLVFPIIAMPKIDGVRAINLDGNLTGRSLKPHANRYVTRMFSFERYLGLDGEMAAGNVSDTDLCRNTTSALNSIKGEPSVVWHVFDLITEATVNLPYQQRYAELRRRVDHLNRSGHTDIQLVPAHHCTTLDQLLELEDKWLDEGMEGVIIRRPDGLYKQGRSTVKEGGLLRIKRFIEIDAKVLEIIEGEANGNEAKTNELGRTERSTHQENMTPNGMVGAMMCELEEPMLDSKGGVLLPKGEVVKVGAGSMPHDMRLYYFLHPEELLNHTIKFKTFPKGVKNKPRFPTFVSVRAESDKV